ncbi:hypothetical protein [Kitasatospora sp. NPDC057198]|uniref:tetratricopeptide repeat protein n=1 Tax=Kitasatospora sp. NPDC057198 TaxID=3346046 RepID=UPI003632509E
MKGTRWCRCAPARKQTEPTVSPFHDRAVPSGFWHQLLRAGEQAYGGRATQGLMTALGGANVTDALSWIWVLDDDPAEHRLSEELGATPHAAVPRLLHDLAQRAAGRDPAALRHFALALALAGRIGEAADLWRELLGSGPQPAAVWLNLSTAHAASGQPERAAQVLRAHGPTAGEPARTEAGRRLAELDRAQRQIARETAMMESQLAAVRERLQHGEARDGDRLRVAGLLYAMFRTPASTVTADEVQAAVQAVLDEDPADPAALELLVGIRIGSGDDLQLGEAVRRLEQVRPDSPVLRVVREMYHDDPALARREAEHHRRTQDLIMRTVRGDQGAEAQVRDLHRHFPRNPEYRIALMMAARNRLDRDEALRHADELAAGWDGEHRVHFHVAQVYWWTGDRPRTYQHFARALATAADARDRADVYEMMQAIGAPVPEEPGRG